MLAYDAKASYTYLLLYNNQKFNFVFIYIRFSKKKYLYVKWKFLIGVHFFNLWRRHDSFHNSNAKHINKNMNTKYKQIWIEKNNEYKRSQERTKEN